MHDRPNTCYSRRKKTVHRELEKTGDVLPQIMELRASITSFSVLGELNAGYLMFSSDPDFSASKFGEFECVRSRKNFVNTALFQHDLETNP